MARVKHRPLVVIRRNGYVDWHAPLLGSVQAPRDPFKSEAPPPPLRRVIKITQTNMEALGGCLLFFTVFTFTVAALTASWSAVVVTALTGIALLLLRRMRQRNEAANRRVCVLVLGDIGRSPRMRYHSFSLSRRGFNVTLVGFVGTIVSS